MDKNINEYKPMQPKTSSTEEKLDKMRSLLLNEEKCRQIALKLSNYIKK